MSKLTALAALVLGTACQVTDADLAHGALTSFTLTPSATTTDRFTMAFTGTVTADYMAPRPATLVVEVEGQPVVEQAVDLSHQLSQDLTVTVPLATEGPNAVSATLVYEGATLTADTSVTVTMTAPAITIPTFATQYTAHVGLDATGTVQVAATSGYTVDAVATSVDGGPWVPATADGNGGWAVALVDPDIGDSDVAVRAQVSIDGHAEATIAHTTLHVDPVFDCNDAASMLPSTTLGSQTEQRVMVGYFGRADGGHDATFVLSGTPQQGQQGTIASQTVDYGTTQVHVAFSPGVLRPCDQCQPTAYTLTALVDGVQICQKTAFGQITR